MSSISFAFWLITSTSRERRSDIAASLSLDLRTGKIRFASVERCACLLRSCWARGLGLVVVGLAPARASAGLSRSDRAAINATLDVFIPAAVARRDSERAWPLATAEMHVGGTRAGWARGELPIPPFPVGGTRFHGGPVDSYRPGAAELVLLLHPRRGSKVGPISYDVAMRKVRGRWLVNSFVPAALFAAAGSRSGITAAADFAPQSKVAPSAARGRISGSWLFAILGGLAGLIVLVPVGVFRPTVSATGGLRVATPRRVEWFRNSARR